MYLSSYLCYKLGMSNTKLHVCRFSHFSGFRSFKAAESVWVSIGECTRGFLEWANVPHTHYICVRLCFCARVRAHPRVCALARGRTRGCWSQIPAPNLLVRSTIKHIHPALPHTFPPTELTLSLFLLPLCLHAALRWMQADPNKDIRRHTSTKRLHLWVISEQTQPCLPTRSPLPYVN